MLYELINITYVLILLIMVKHFFAIKPLFFWILLLHFFAIYFFNGLLFSPTYMPDQFSYLYVTEHLRALDFGNDAIYAKGSTVLIAGIFFALFPLPFIHSIYSLSAINYLLYLYLFLFMHKKKLLNSQAIMYFYLFYPSLLLYSSVALRDMLIFFIMFFGTYLILISKKNLFGLITFLPLILIKFQNFIILILSSSLGLFFSKKTNATNKIYIFASLLILLILFKDYFALEKINYFRLSFYNENSTSDLEPFTNINSYFELILYSFPNAFEFLFRPLPWKETGFLQIIQFIENCSIAFLIGHILYQNIKYNLILSYEIKTLNILLIIALIIYGLVIYNSGTAVRYKFPFIAIYIIFSYYFIHQFKKHIKQ